MGKRIPYSNNRISNGAAKDSIFDTDPLWNVEDVANYLRLEPDTVRSMARRALIPGIKMGRMWRFRSKDIRLWVKGRIDLI